MNVISKAMCSIMLITSTVLGTANAIAQEKTEKVFGDYTFVPKGKWVAGLSASFSQSNNNNYQFLIVENISGNTYSMKVSPMFCYIFKDNLGIGGRFGYSRSRTKYNSADLILDTETSYEVENYYSINQTFSGMGIFRTYIPLGHQNRFALFNEVQLEFGYGESKLTKGLGTDFSGTFQRNYSVNLGLCPGMVMFLNNYSAIEVNVGVLGFGYTHTKSTTDQIYVANLKTQSANFKVNLFSISFGAVFYL